MQDAVKLKLLSTLVQTALFIAILPTFIKYHLGPRFICCQLLLVVLNAVPPLLPSASAVLGARTILRMRQQNLHVADPQKLLSSAQVDMLLLDKTGTLTVGQVSPRDCLNAVGSSWETHQLL